MKKRVLAVIVCLCVILGTAGTAIAATSDVGIAPMWTNANTIKLNISLSGGTITSEGTVTGKAGTTAISATFTLEKLVDGKYTPVDQWTATGAMLLSSSHKTTGCTSGTYKLSISATVTKGGITEAVSDWLTKAL